MLLERAARHGDAVTCSLVIPCEVTDDYRKQSRNTCSKRGIKNYFVSGNVNKKAVKIGWGALRLIILFRGDVRRCYFHVG